MTITPPDPVGEVADILKVVVVLLILAAFGYLVWDNSHLRGEVTEQGIEISDFKTANQDLTTEVGQCNASVAALKTQTDARTQAVNQAVAALQSIQAQDNATIAKLMAQKPASNDDCTAARAFMTQYLKGKP